MKMGHKTLFNLMNESIVETQFKGEDILYFSGKFAGQKYSKTMRSIKRVEDLESMLKSVCNDLAIGNLNKMEMDKNRFLINLNDCVLSKSKQKNKHNFLLGFITGLISGVMSYNFHRFRGEGRKVRSRGPGFTFEVTSI